MHDLLALSRSFATGREILHSHLAKQLIPQNHLWRLRCALDTESKADENGAAREP